jgi:hypothetical protein
MMFKRGLLRMIELNSRFGSRKNTPLRAGNSRMRASTRRQRSLLRCENDRT